MPEMSPKIPESSSQTSAIEVPLPAEAQSLYREVLSALNDHGVAYAVAGAFALQKYTGIWRLTKDLDLFMKSEDVPGALKYLGERNFRCPRPGGGRAERARKPPSASRSTQRCIRCAGGIAAELKEVRTPEVRGLRSEVGDRCIPYDHA